MNLFSKLVMQILPHEHQLVSYKNVPLYSGTRQGEVQQKAKMIKKNHTMLIESGI